MDGLKSARVNKNCNIVVVGATNRPFDLDEAVLRRLPRRILVDLPNQSMRKDILGSYLKDEKLEADADLDRLAQETDHEGFSGSDLKNLCVAAAMASVKEAIGPNWQTRADAPVSLKELPPRVVSMGNIRRAQLEVGASPGDRCERLRTWDARYGSKKSIAAASAGVV